VVPRAVANDNGADLAGGIRLLKKATPASAADHGLQTQGGLSAQEAVAQRHPLEGVPKALGPDQGGDPQTELAFLAPPSQRSKARYMNVDKLVVWAEKVLAVAGRQVGIASGDEVGATGREAWGG